MLWATSVNRTSRSTHKQFPQVFGRRPVDRAHVPAVVGADDFGGDPVPGPEVLGEEDRGEDAVHVRAQDDADALFEKVVDADRAQDARLQERFPHAYISRLVGLG